MSFVNTKGGVGKSFLSVHLAVWLFDKGQRVALIDADDQQTSARWLLGVADHAVEVIALKAVSEDQRSNELRHLINALSSKTDFVIVDTKGNAGLSTSAAVIKSDVACVPLQASAADLWPIENALSTIRLSQEARAGLPQTYLILNQTSDTDVVAREVRRQAETFGVPIAQTNVKRLHAYRNATGLRIVVTRLNDRIGRSAANRLDKLFDELIGPHIADTQEAIHE
ncbi:MAG: ParA family protein [Fuerstiella sp.]|nr:ParA family protein [Fuerstiella sp.]